MQSNPMFDCRSFNQNSRDPGAAAGLQVLSESRSAVVSVTGTLGFLSRAPAQLKAEAPSSMLNYS